MSGIRVDTEWLTRYASDVRTAGEEVVAAQRELVREPPADAFGELGSRVGAPQAYTRVAALLAERARRAGEVLVNAGNELHEVVDFHTTGDGDSAHDLARER